MTGHAVKGYSGFLPKDGENFDRRLNVRIHDDVVSQMEAAKEPGDSLADVIRRALNEHLARHRANGENEV